MDKYSVYSDDKLIFELYPYSDVHQHVKVINANTIPYKVFLHLPKVVSANYAIYKFEQILPETGEVNFGYTITQDEIHPWLDLLSDVLDWSIGQHMYKLSFVQKTTNETCDLYFSYRLQNNNPEKPYDYMSKYGTCYTA